MRFYDPLLAGHVLAPLLVSSRPGAAPLLRHAVERYAAPLPSCEAPFLDRVSCDGGFLGLLRYVEVYVRDHTLPVLDALRPLAHNEAADRLAALMFEGLAASRRLKTLRVRPRGGGLDSLIGTPGHAAAHRSGLHVGVLLLAAHVPGAAQRLVNQHLALAAELQWSWVCWLASVPGAGVPIDVVPLASRIPWDPFAPGLPWVSTRSPPQA